MIDQLYEEIQDMDSNEPSAMEMIRQYRITLKDEDEQYMQLLVEKISDEEIYWDRPWYQMSKSLTRPFKQENHDEEAYETYKTDSLNSDEVAAVNKNWCKFIRKYKVPDKPLSFARWRNKQNNRNPTAPEEKVRYFITAYLARGLKRTLHQVYKHVVTNYGAPVKGYYSYKEEKIMEICFQNDPRNAVTICAMVLGREPRGLYNKLKISIHGKQLLERKKMKGKWTLEKANRLLKLLMKFTDLPLDELKNKRFEKDVWQKMEEEFGHHYVYLQQFWERNLHVQLFVKKHVSLRRLRKRIYRKLQKSTYKVWTDIRWKEVLKMFSDGYTHHFLYRVAYQGLRGLPEYLKVPLPEVLDHGFNNLIKFSYHYDKILKNLILDANGDLTVAMRYDEQ